MHCMTGMYKIFWPLKLGGSTASTKSHLLHGGLTATMHFGYIVSSSSTCTDAGPVLQVDLERAAWCAGIRVLDADVMLNHRNIMCEVLSLLGGEQLHCWFYEKRMEQNEAAILAGPLIPTGGPTVFLALLCSFPIPCWSCDLEEHDRASVDGAGEDDRDEAKCEVYGCDDAHEDEVAAFANRYTWWD